MAMARVVSVAAEVERAPEVPVTESVRPLGAHSAMRAIDELT